MNVSTNVLDPDGGYSPQPLLVSLDVEEVSFNA